MQFTVHPYFNGKYHDLKSVVLDFENQGTVLSDGKRNLIKVVEWQGFKYNIKSFKKPHFLNAVIYKFFRKSKARRSFEYARKLMSRGIGTPAPIAYGEEFSFWGLRESFYVSEHLSCDFTIREVLNDENFPDGDKIMKQFIEFTFRLHEAGVEFLDHSPGNTLVVKNDEEDYEFYLVDLNRMNFKKLSFKNRMKNFARLTKDRNRVQQMSAYYAALIKASEEKVFRLMWKYTEAFQTKFQRKKRLKNRFKISK